MNQATKNELQTQQHIPLNKLDLAAENVRKTDVTARQGELKASIKTHGLLQPLLIRPSDKKGRFAVVDGQRRLLAMKALVKDKQMKADFSVKCEQVNPEIAQELSLTANVQTQTMHPADQFEAFSALNDNKLSVGDIAARFGVSEKIVKQRLKLAKVSPKLLEEYRKGQMTLEHLEAFTLTDDHEKQETVWDQLNDWQRNPHEIKAMLTEQKISSSDHRISFITLEAYQKAGGHLESDLFSEDIYLTDLALIDRLFEEKLKEAAKAVKAEGWAFVEVSPAYDYNFTQQYLRIWPESVELNDKDSERLETIQDEINDLNERYADADNQDELEKKIETLEIEQEQLEEKKQAFTQEQKASAGAYLSYEYGDIYITRGLSEKPALTKQNKKELKEKAEISERLLERLTSHKTLALQDALAKSPQIAFDLMLVQIVKVTFLNDASMGYSCFHLQMGEPRFPHDDESLKNNPSVINRKKDFEQWEKALHPQDDDTLFEKVSALKQKQKMELLAFCFARTLDAVKHPKENMATSKQDKINGLADLLELDMTQYWKPSASLYFLHIAKDDILTIVKDVKGINVSDALKKLKKNDLANAAEKHLEDSDWLPKPLQVGIHKPQLA